MAHVRKLRDSIADRYRLFQRGPLMQAARASGSDAATGSPTAPTLGLAQQVDQQEEPLRGILRMDGHYRNIIFRFSARSAI